MVPDIVLPDTLNAMTDVGESSLANAMPWDTIPKADYNRSTWSQPYVSELRRLSDARVATNQDFSYIRQDIEEFKKLQADKTASLNEDEELKQAEEDALREKARETERAGRKAPDEKIYEITVENAGKPGMPPMLWPTNMVSPSTNTAAVSPPTSRLAKAAGTINVAVTTTGTNAPPTDQWLVESEHILEDYISLMDKNRQRATNQ